MCLEAGSGLGPRDGHMSWSWSHRHPPLLSPVLPGAVPALGSSTQAGCRCSEPRSIPFPAHFPPSIPPCQFQLSTRPQMQRGPGGLHLFLCSRDGLRKWAGRSPPDVPMAFATWLHQALEECLPTIRGCPWAAWLLVGGWLWPGPGWLGAAVMDPLCSVVL